MNKIKFGTDGWRAIIADDFTIENLKRVAEATALWVNKHTIAASVVVGYDTRFGGKLFAETTARVLAAHNIKVHLSHDFVSTPMVSLATKNLGAACGIIITASHNPASYNGFKIKGSYGGPATPAMIDEVENLIPTHCNTALATIEALTKNGMVTYEDFETMYVNHAEKSFDMDAIRNSPFRIGYDAMYGAGQNAVKRLLPKAFMLHASYNPSFMGQAPEPILKNLKEISEHIKTAGNIDIAFATDGDADRIGLLDSKGNFVDSHHIILMLVNYLNKYKGIGGSVVNSFSCTSRIGRMCLAYNLENITTGIGFKYICEYMVNTDVLVGGEESGGIAVKNHIPERDGVWIALVLLEYMAKSGKSLEELVAEVYAITGTFAMDRIDLHITEEQKNTVMESCKQRAYINFGKYQISYIEDTDGYKFHLGNGAWVMIRASGTEPVLRVYSEADTAEEAASILQETKAAILTQKVGAHA
ncbi:MAG: phosphoglucomutase/phosphomannomutase family protein [Bacteroidetes bacterium]|nr:phosphoglucomutase/phosphomannomutase family protein [Bacteroidota bacterium]